MSITFHCEYCGKEIRAADSAGGKWGKCPSCHKRIYVPDLSEDDDLKLAPVDENEEKRKKQLMAETFKLEQDILSEREVPREGESHDSPIVSEFTGKELTKNIILILRQMADGDLDEAERTINSIIPHAREAGKIIDSIAVSEIPEPELDDIPPQVLAGLIRTLRGKIS
jgi:hypothetical protein